jgi:hypothetical protein
MQSLVGRLGTTSLTTTAGLDSGAQSCSSDDSTSSAVTDNPKIHVTSISRGSLKTPITSTQLSSENVHQPCSSHDSNPNVEDTTETPNITTTEVDEMQVVQSASNGVHFIVL